MFPLLLLLAIVVALVLLRRSGRQHERLQRLEALTELLSARLEVLTDRITALDPGAPEPPVPSVPEAPRPTAPFPSPAARDPSGPLTTARQAAPDGRTARAPAPAAPLAGPVPPRPVSPTSRPAAAASPGGASPRAAGSGAWRRIERLLIENWTGILGVVVVVAGVTFLAVHLAVQLGPFARFLLTSAVAAGLALPSLLWGRRRRWRPLTHWLRSGGAALFLFACAAAGGLPGLGLRWIADPRGALALLALAMAVNLALARRARNQTLAALHVVVNLVPLLLVPPSGMTLAIASGVSLLGILLPRRPRWNGHQLVVTWSYALFHAAWILQNATALQQDDGLRTGAALAAVLVFGGGLLRQHRRAVALPRATLLPVAVLTSQWGALALALLLYPRTAGGRAGALALAAAAALLLARRARGAGWRWLRLGDTLVAQGLVMVALVALAPLVANPLLLLASLLGETLLFLALGVREGEAAIRRIGWGLAALVAGLLALMGVAAALGAAPAAQGLQNALVLLGGGALLTGVQQQLTRRGVSLPLPPLLGWQAGALSLVGAAVVAPRDWQAPLALAALGGSLLVEGRQRTPGVRGGAAAAVLGVHAVGGLSLLLEQPLAPEVLALRLLPLAVLAAVLHRTSAATGNEPTGGGADPAGLLGLDLLGLDAGLAAWLAFAPLSPLIPPVAWLLLSVVALEAAHRLRRPDALHALGLGLLALGAVAVDWLLVISQSPAVLDLAGWPLRARLLIELFGLALLLHWWWFRPRRAVRRSRLWRAVHPCFLEAVVLGAVVTVLGEVSTLWRPLAWALLALALLSDPLRHLFAARMRLYSLMLHWVASASLVALLGTSETPARAWFAQPQTIGLVAIGLQVAYVVASQHWLRGEDLRRPGGWPLLGWIGTRVADRPNRWVCYPVFLGVAWYLAVRYDHTVLTLLWATEAFVVFALSAVLRDNQFRTLALIAMGACLVRLVAIDMAEADLGLRGLVFIGVGLLMVGMNAIVSRYRERFR